MTDTRRALTITSSFMLLHGLASIMIGTTLPEMINAFGLSLTQGGLIVSAQAAGGLIIMFAGMAFADRVSKPGMIIASVIGAGVSIAATGVAPAYWFVVVVFFVNGIIVQVLDMMLNAFTGDISGSGRTRALNLLHMLYGVGAFVGPVFARWLLNAEVQWSQVYFIVGGIYLGSCALSLIWVKSYVALGSSSGTPSEDRAAGDETDAPAPGHEGSANSGRRGAWVSVTLAGSIVLFYAVHQLSTSAWLPLYMTTILGTGADLASAALSFYWVAIIASRFLASVFARRIGELRIIIWGSLAGGIVLIVVVLLGVPWLALAGFIFAGFVTGAIIPLCMSIAFGYVPSQTGMVTSLVYGLMMTGRLIGPWMVGSVGDRLGLDTGVLLAAGVLLIAGIVGMILRAKSGALSEGSTNE